MWHTLGSHQHVARLHRNLGVADQERATTGEHEIDLVRPFVSVQVVPLARLETVQAQHERFRFEERFLTHLVGTKPTTIDRTKHRWVCHRVWYRTTTMGGQRGRDEFKTLKGYATGSDPDQPREDPGDEVKPIAQVEGHAKREGTALKPDQPEAKEDVQEGVEVQFVQEQSDGHESISEWRAFEVWTRNNIYSVDWSMACKEVVDRTTGKSVPDHRLLGAYLAGGQRQTDSGMALSYPAPEPGSEAVFEYRGKREGFFSTSRVSRVVLRLRVLNVPNEKVQPAWTRLTGSHRRREK